MIKRIDLSQFKCFEKLGLPIGQLTLLTGLNGSGKSTVIQALVVLHQTIIENEWSTELLLDGSKISLGTVGDVIDQVSGRNQFMIGLDWEGINCQWNMETIDSDRTPLSVPLRSIQWDGRPFTELQLPNAQPVHFFLPNEIIEVEQNEKSQSLAKALQDLVYISAERCGPRETYSLSTAKHKIDVGRNGDRAPAVIYNNPYREVSTSLCLAEYSSILPRQVEAWMNTFFPGAGIDIQPVKNASMVTLGLRTSPSDDFQRPQNVGYGLSHILPIITACLVAKVGEILLIENPEVHMHPAGQTLIGSFLAKVAATGVQIILETHSDHVLNGVRRAVREKTLAPSQVQIHFFTRRTQNEDTGSQVNTITVQENGGLDSWPDGFFDQFDKDLSFLTGWDA